MSFEADPADQIKNRMALASQRPYSQQIPVKRDGYSLATPARTLCPFARSADSPRDIVGFDHLVIRPTKGYHVRIRALGKTNLRESCGDKGS